MVTLYTCTPDTPVIWWTHIAIAATATALAVICVCRMNALTARRHKLAPRLRYLALFVGSLGAALSPWAHPANPRAGGLFLVVAVVVFLLLSAPEWRHGAPAHTESDWASLEPERKRDEQFSDTCLQLEHAPNSLWRRIRRCWLVGKYILRGGS